MPPLTPELQAAVAAQLEYYRDLGIFDFYRRAVSEAPIASDLATSAVPLAGQLPTGEPDPIAAPPQENPEEIPIAARKASPPLSFANPTQNYTKIQGKGAPALQQIREEIGDCTRCKLSVGR